ncbi:MAG: PRC-barrel domain-containing protein [Xanthomonadales bacterium]|nr:PRC-barrel domain-containing protein [Xanthomonadales bacterium]
MNTYTRPIEHYDISAEKLLGQTVVDEDGNRIGQVQDILIERDGRIAFLKVTFADSDSSKLAVPWSHVNIDSRISLNIKRQSLARYLP